MKIRGTSATLLLVFLCATVVSTHPGAASAQQRYYYLTKNAVPADKALTACARGYHMASIVELSAPGTLHYYYNHAYAYSEGLDQGHSPPLNTIGWIRTANAPGLNNCTVWSSVSPAVTGTVAYLVFSKNVTTRQLTWSWFTKDLSCNGTSQVWCVENP